MKKNNHLKTLFVSLSCMLILIGLGDACNPTKAFCARTGADVCLDGWKGVFGSGMLVRELSVDKIFNYFGSPNIPPLFVRTPLMKIDSMTGSLGLRMPLSLKAQACRSPNRVIRDFGAFEAERTDPYKSLPPVVPLLSIQGDLDSCFTKFRLFMQRIGRDDYRGTGVMEPKQTIINPR